VCDLGRRDARTFSGFIRWDDLLRLSLIPVSPVTGDAILIPPAGEARPAKARCSLPCRAPVRRVRTGRARGSDDFGKKSRFEGFREIIRRYC
jgi:hypothetical protein